MNSIWIAKGGIMNDDVAQSCGSVFSFAELTYGHIFGGKPSDGYATCKLCGARENTDKIVNPCPENPICEFVYQLEKKVKNYDRLAEVLQTTIDQERRDIIALLIDPHWINATIRKDGKEIIVEADYIKHTIKALLSKINKLENELIARK